jgi:hypothetical protein
MTEQEFCDRFTAEMLRLAGRKTFDDGSSIEEYARGTAPSYYADQHQDGESPEDCADADMDCWE